MEPLYFKINGYIGETIYIGIFIFIHGLNKYNSLVGNNKIVLEFNNYGKIIGIFDLYNDTLDYDILKYSYNIQQLGINIHDL